MLASVSLLKSFAGTVILLEYFLTLIVFVINKSNTFTSFSPFVSAISKSPLTWKSFSPASNVGIPFNTKPLVPPSVSLVNLSSKDNVNWPDWVWESKLITS